MYNIIVNIPALAAEGKAGGLLSYYARAFVPFSQSAGGRRLVTAEVQLFQFMNYDL